MSNNDNLKRPRFLEGERLFLTPLSMADLDKNFRWDNDADMSFLDGGSFRPKTHEVAREEFEKTLKSGKSMFFSIILKEDGEQIGNIVLFNILEYHRRCHWGIKLGKEHWRNGYGTEAARLLISYVFDDLGFQRLKSDTHESNVASMKFQESLGFVKEGTFRKERYVRGKYLDDICYAMIREDFEGLYGNE